ncbi:phosphotriesterase family protein [Entomospira culicis]|nr:phosphotriesterase-related protein [Entomospira culicis]WDI36628.1 phosphotriesterase-related protein [Entomospira culicis]WDI38256.1 phosphotriesterase-related protein [Entomospira culicis]
MLVDGITYIHEHTTIDLSYVKGNSDTLLRHFEATVAEYRALYTKGVRNIVDVTTLGMHRDAQYVAEVARASGMNILQATGFYTQKFYAPFEPWFSQCEAKEIAEVMHKEIAEGLDGTTIKPQIIGEIGTSKDGWTPLEQKLFEAAVMVHRESCLPIATHCTLGTFAQEQMAFFQERGVELTRVMLGHIDLKGDLDYTLRLLEQGVYIGFDTIGKENYLPDSQRIAMLKAIEARGYIGQVMLSMDITRQSHLKVFGGIGYSYLLDTFVPKALEAGLSQRAITQMLRDNPQQFFGKG